MAATPPTSLPSEKHDALSHLQKGHWLEAQRMLIVFCANNEGDAEAWLMLGAANGQLGLFDESIACCARAVALRPNYVDAHFNLAQAYMHKHDYAAASYGYRNVTQLQPDNVMAWNNLGFALQNAEQYSEAIAVLSHARQLHYENPDICNNLGDALQHAHEYEKAEQCYRDAIRSHPKYALAHFNLGMLLLSKDELQEAENSLKTALACRPDYVDASIALGIVFAARNDIVTAENYYKHALTIAPQSVEAYRLLAALLSRQGRLDETEKLLRKALRLQPEDPDLLKVQGRILFKQGLHSESVAIARRLLQRQPKSVGLRASLCFKLLHSSDNPMQILTEHRQLAEQIVNSVPLTCHARPCEFKRRLRVGYVSADFFNHAAAGFIEPIIANHDPESVECYCYANVATPDTITIRFKTLAHIWRDISNLSDDEAASLIISDDIDILVDLAGHTAGNRLGVFARKPAPLQISFLGYPATTGLPVIDYYLTDTVADPEGAEPHYVERLLRLDCCFTCYTPPLHAPDVAPLPALENHRITFGSLNKLSKMGPGVVELWARVLRTVRGSRLLIFRHELQENMKQRIRDRFAQQGINPERIELINQAPLGQSHLWPYSQIDIMLDTFPWNGHVTTCEALWMGVPVITLYGNTHAGRMATSLLAHMGLKEWAAQTPRDYVRIAVEKARDHVGLAHLREQLREDMRTSLCNGATYTRSLEAAYRRAWIDWCSNTGLSNSV